jgi:hypothetical protein
MKYSCGTMGSHSTFSTRYTVMDWMRDSAWGFVSVVIAVVALAATISGVDPITVVGISAGLVIVFSLIMISRRSNRSAETLENQKLQAVPAPAVMMEELVNTNVVRFDTERKPKETDLLRAVQSIIYREAIDYRTENMS